MAVKLPDTLVPMADFPSAYAKDVQFTDGENLQDKLDNGKLGSSSSGTGLTEEQANNIEKIPSIEGIVTSNSQAIANKADKDHEHTEYLTEIPDEYVTDSDLTEIKETTNSIIPIYNHINLSDITRGKYFIDYKPWIKNGTGYSCVKVPVFKGLTYSSDEVFTNFTMFEDLTGARTKILDTSKQFDKINGYIPSEDGFLCLSFQTSIADRFMLVNSKYAPTKYTQYKKPYSYILGDIDTTNLSKKYDDKNDIYYDLTVITVAKDGTGDYDNLIDAYNSIQNNSINNRHLIKVKKGVYDFGEKFNSVTATHYVGILLNKHYVYFEGEDPTNTILYFDGCPIGTTQITNEQAFRVSLFHWGAKNTFKGHIKNFTLRAKNCRYALHPETAGQGNGGDWLIENVIFDFLGNPNVESWKGASVGIGMSCGEKGHFKNCKWTNFDGTVEGIVGHNNGFDYTDKPFTIPSCQLTFENCDFGNTIVHIDNYKNASDFYDIFKLINCTNIARGYFGHQNGQLENVWRCINKGSKITVDEFDYLTTTIPEEYLTEILDEYVTDTELSSKRYATETFVTSKIAEASLSGSDVDLSGYATKDDVPTKTSELTNDSGFITSIPLEYVTETELNSKGYLTEHQDISNLALKSEIPDVSSFITSDDLPTVPTKVSELTNDKNYISSIPSEYVTETELNAKKYLTSVPSTYALKTDIPTVPTKTSQLTNDSKFITSIPKEYITETELNAKGYLTKHQDISNLQPKTDNSLSTTNKTVVRAINELKSIIDTLQNKITALENQQSATVKVTGVTLSTNTLSMKVGGTTTLTANIRPSNATNKNVTWSTNNGSVASVNNGVVTAKAKGQATITVRTEDGGHTDTCIVTVSETVTTISVTGVTLNKDTLTMNKIGGTQTLSYTITPSNATNKNVTWSTSVPTVASVNNGIVTANANGTTVITIKTTDGSHTDTCTVTVNDPSYIEGGGDDKLYVPNIASYGISKDGTNSEATTNGLNRLFADLNTSGKTNVQLPTGTYAINPDISLTPKSNLTLDLNNSKLKIDTNAKNGSTMVYLKEVENLTLKNGTIEGDRYDHDYSTYNENTTSHEFNVGLKIDQGARNITIDNVKFTKITGYGLATFQGTQYCNVALDKTKMESGDYNDSGSKVADATKIRYPQAVNITEHATHGYLQVGTLLKYQNYVFNSTRMVTVRMFNASGSLLSKVTSKMYRPIAVPSDATKAYLTFHQSDPADYLEGDMYTLDVFHMKPPRDCNITNCTFDDNRCLGIAMCGGWNIKIEGNTFKNTSKPTSDKTSPNYQHGKPGYAIDIEDGWESTQDLTINNNTFTNNGFGDIVSLAGDNTVITNNEFTGRVAMYSRNTNYVVKNNTISNGIAMWETEKDYGFTVDHNTYTDTTIKAKCHKPYDDDYYTFTNETITNGQMQLDTSITLKNSTITLDGTTGSRFTGSYDTCTIKNFDGSDSNSDYNTGIKLNNCDVSNSNFFPSKDTVMTNNTFNRFRVRLDNGTLIFTGNDIQSNPKNTKMPIVQLNGGKSATIKKNTLGSAVTVDLYTNPANIPVITDDDDTGDDDFNWNIEVANNESPQFNYYKAGLYHANGIDGRGIKIGLFDSSYRSATNNDLVVKDLNNTTASTDDHATMVAGVIGSKKFGVAPGAELYNVVGEKTSSEVTGIAGAIDKAIAGGIKIFVITAGWSGMNNISSDNLQQISNAFDRAKEAGMFVFLSGGNTPNSMLLEKPQEIGWKVIMISGCDANGEYANQGTENYYSAVSSFYNCYSYKGKNFATGINEGTSVGTPLAAGLCALMLQQKPDFTPDELRRYLIDTAKYPDPDTSNTKKGIIQLTRINKNTKYVTQSEIDAEEARFVDMTKVNLKNIGDYKYNSSSNTYELTVSKGTVLDLSHTLEPANCTDHVRWSCGRRDLFTIDNDNNRVTCSSTATGFNIIQAKDRHYKTLLRLKITIS